MRASINSTSDPEFIMEEPCSKWSYN